jgi:hypothetical protein
VLLLALLLLTDELIKTISEELRHLRVPLGELLLGLLIHGRSISLVMVVVMLFDHPWRAASRQQRTQ